ncbi:hypothetical protein CYR55_14245 [Chimaeribacter californicus]|uniref:Uncharacterized protein n=1 Tax=Chimaeribacter californicus TaxID=2060067 RepID=A0A2N5E2Z0_9GAMM|nr:ParB family protein [Chimaeribacter californicus]PLR35057.1 hypothetical protein CYR55_14245 [Chimaeribacter californicus]
MTSDSLGAKLLQRGRSPKVTDMLPVNEMPMVLTLDQLRPNPDNPRTSRNPKYEDIKASIHARGLDTVPKVTKDPDSADDFYIFSDGGNTRYAILLELYQQTGDERFYRVPCMVKPWPGRIKCVVGHLAENDVRGDLTFIEKALGIENARTLYQEQLGRTVSQRELAELLKADGYPVNHSSISRMAYAVEHLYPYMPDLLKSGLGRPQVIQLIALRTAAEKAWAAFSQATDVTLEQTFDEVFGGVCRSLDDPDSFSHDVLKDELIGALLKALPDPQYTYDSWLIELDPQELNRRKLFGAPELVAPPVIDDATLPAPDIFTAEKAKPRNPSPPKTALSPMETSSKKASCRPDTNTLQEEEYTPPEHAEPPENKLDDLASLTFAESGLEPVMDIWHIASLQDDIEHLQDMAFRLAFEISEAMGGEASILEDKSPQGAGYAVSCQEQPGEQLLMALCGDTALPGTLSLLSTMLTGSANPLDAPPLEDRIAVKFLRLLRVLRRLRELQRQNDQEDAL